MGSSYGPTSSPYSRSGFPYQPSYPASQVQHQYGNFPPPTAGNQEWFEFHARDPSNVTINFTSGSILPWKAIRPNFGLIVSHPVPLHLHQLDRTHFLSHFQSVTFQSKLLKQFQDGFPVFPSNGNRRSLLPYVMQIVGYGTLFGVYVPPVHTLVPGNLMGTWYPLLPAWTQNHSATVFPGLLLNCLSNKKANLVNNEDFGGLLHHLQNGYFFLYQLAIIGGHPLLLEHPSPPLPPRQRDTHTIADYISLWQQYLFIRLLSGIYLSDRYFLMLFIRGLRPEFALIRQYINETMAPYDGPFTINEAAPLTLSPERLLLSLQQHTTWLSQPKLCLTPARDSKRSPSRPGPLDGLALRALGSDLSPPDPDLAALTSDQDDAIFLHAVLQRPRGCFFCQEDGHSVRECTRFAKLKTNPYGLKTLHRILAHAVAPSSAPSASPKINQVSFDALGLSDLPSEDSDDALDFP
jgi:hypothetical protein